MLVLVAHKSLQVCSGPVSPVIIMHSSSQTPKQSDPCPRYPHHMSLHGGWQVLYLYHGNCASKISKVSLNPPKSPLGLSFWEVPCYCCSPGGGSCGLWLWAAPVPCKIGRSHGSHICMQHKVHPSKNLLYKNMIYISKRHKNYICKQKNYTGRDLAISPRSSLGGTGIAGSLEKSIPAYG
jgi:hypothetical protein